MARPVWFRKLMVVITIGLFASGAIAESVF